MLWSIDLAVVLRCYVHYVICAAQVEVAIGTAIDPM